MWLALAGEVAGQGRSADALAMHRDAWDFRNGLLVEQPNGDFGQTMMRQFLFDQAHVLLLDALQDSGDERVAAIAAKSVKEVRYHVERSAEVVIALGDGTDESHARMQAALIKLAPYASEMFQADQVDAEMAAGGIMPDPAMLEAPYWTAVRAVLDEATLTQPDSAFAHSGGRNGTRHSEHLGHLLTQMQWLQRAYPEATW